MRLGGRVEVGVWGLGALKSGGLELGGGVGGVEVGGWVGRGWSWSRGSGGLESEGDRGVGVARLELGGGVKGVDSVVWVWGVGVRGVGVGRLGSGGEFGGLGLGGCSWLEITLNVL